MKTWFATKILFRAEVADGLPMPPLHEESIRLVLATDESEAIVLATRVGQDGAHEYLNGDGKLVTWVFGKVVEVQDLGAEEIVDGMEVWSRMYREG